MTESKTFGALLLDIGIALLQAGASSSRISITMTKLAVAYHYNPHITIGSKSVLLALDDEDGNMVFNGIRSTPVHGIDFAVISGISRLSQLVTEKKLPVQELTKEFHKSKTTGHYSRLIVLGFVSLAGAAFCYTFGGSYVEMSITFGATFCGLFVKQQLTKSRFNPYVCTYVAATVASLFIGLFHVAQIIISPAKAFSTCVLFLIPGVPLINAVTDLINGNTINGMVRGTNALIHAFAIALGLVTTIVLLNLRD